MECHLGSDQQLVLKIRELIMRKKVSELAKKSKPYLGIISLQFGYAGLNILATVCLKHGMNHFILAFYRHVFATFAIAPFALFFDRYLACYISPIFRIF